MPRNEHAARPSAANAPLPDASLSRMPPAVIEQLHFPSQHVVMMQDMMWKRLGLVEEFMHDPRIARAFAEFLQSRVAKSGLCRSWSFGLAPFPGQGRRAGLRALCGVFFLPAGNQALYSRCCRHMSTNMIELQSPYGLAALSRQTRAGFDLAERRHNKKL